MTFNEIRKTGNANVQSKNLSFAQFYYKLKNQLHMINLPKPKSKEHAWMLCPFVVSWFIPSTFNKNWLEANNRSCQFYPEEESYLMVNSVLIFGHICKISFYNNILFIGSIVNSLIVLFWLPILCIKVCFHPSLCVVYNNFYNINCVRNNVHLNKDVYKKHWCDQYHNPSLKLCEDKVLKRYW